MEVDECTLCNMGDVLGGANNVLWDGYAQYFRLFVFFCSVYVFEYLILDEGLCGSCVYILTYFVSFNYLTILFKNNEQDFIYSR